MLHRIYRSIEEPIRENPTFEERWKGEDSGLITCWEVGRKKSNETPDLAVQAKNGELPTLGWKGGVEKKIQKKEKYGTLQYLAQWQGLRGENLDIDCSEEKVLVCSKTGMRVVFTSNLNKIIEP